MGPKKKLKEPAKPKVAQTPDDESDGLSGTHPPPAPAATATVGDTESAKPPGKKRKLATGDSDTASLFQLVSTTEDPVGDAEEGAQQYVGPGNKKPRAKRNAGKLCENQANCGNELGKQTHAGPNGSRLCNPCGLRYKYSITNPSGDANPDAWRKRHSAPRAPRALGDKKEKKTECENFKNCGNYVGDHRHAVKLPNGQFLCSTCAARYRYHMNKIEDDWRVPHASRFDDGESSDGGASDGEENKHGKGKNRRIPRAKDGKARDKDGQDQKKQKDEGEGDDEARCNKCKAKCSLCTKLDRGKACKICARLVDEDTADEDGYCETCSLRKAANAPARPHIHAIAESTRKVAEVPFATLREIAHREHRRLHALDPFLEEQHVPTGYDYWSDTRAGVLTELRRRGFFYVGMKTMKAMVNTLQSDDAWNGYLPTHRSVASELHDLSVQALRDRAAAAGFPFKKLALTVENYIDFLQCKRDADDEVIEIPQDRLSIIMSAVSNVSARLRQAGYTENATHRTFNNGLVGQARAISRLHTTLDNGHSPAWTSGVGFLCGPNALEMSINAIRRTYYGRTNSAVYANQVSRDMLMGLLFHNAADSGERDAVGIPTTAYQAYLDDRLSHLDESLRGEEYMNMTRLNNMDIAQLVAMVVLAHRAGLIEMEFSVAYARGSTTNDDGSVVPALVNIAHEGDENAPTVFLHHNMAASHEDYSHWEGFDVVTMNTDRQIVFEWGLSTPLARDSPRLRFNAGLTTSETAIDRLRREVSNAQAALSRHLSSNRNACIPCRKSGKYLSCKRTGGRRFCDPCEEQPNSCQWETGSALSYHEGKMTGSEYTAERRLEWLKLQDIGEQEEQMLRSLDSLMDPDIDGPNFFVFGHARHSSHPGAPTMNQTLQGLLQTINSYSNFMNNPANQMPEGQRPGGAVTPMQTHRTVIARHGARPVPTHTGNLDDPMLHAFLAMVDHLLRPNNTHPPIEIHFLLLGIAGFSVGIEGWGDRVQGFFHEILLRDAANNTNYANTIYLVFVIERHVVDPVSPSSINHGLPAHGARYLTKQIVKVRLADMIDRHRDLKNHAIAIGHTFSDYLAQIMLLHRGMPCIFNNTPLPAWPGGASMGAKLDRMIMAMSWEHAWRTAWLDATTAPTDVMVHANNTNRNSPM